MIWLRCRAGLRIGTGHAERCLTLAKAIQQENGKAGLILDQDAKSYNSRANTAGLPVQTMLPGEPLAAEAADYPDGPVVLDLSNPTLLDGLSDLVAALKAQDRPVALIEGLDHEAYNGAATPDLVITPYLGALPRDSAGWIGGGEYAVLGEEYATEPTPLEDRNSILMMMSGSDPWHLTETTLAAAKAFGKKLIVVIGGSIPEERARQIAAEADAIGARVAHAPSTLHPLFLQSRAALIGPGLVKYEAIATRTPPVIVSPGDQFVATQSAFVETGLAEVLSSTQPDFAEALKQSLYRALQSTPDWPAIIDGLGARRVARQLIARFGE
ncbi:hypothetical protein [Hyphobacterium sp.]|uniref:hypothetical protein n=1 Tax=Hyphobacterium sp. TaxID=2004662 RepID=UPI003BAA0C86